MAPANVCTGEEGKLVFYYVAKNDFLSLKSIILQHNLNVDIYDEHGMTPLKSAAYNGHKEICQFLLDQGADVNCKNHEHGYTALHFAALSGNAEVCQLLLDSGANSHPLNSVGRTPSQMAAFVGFHNCVAVINNYIPKSEVEYYTLTHGLETEPKLPSVYASPLHKFIMQVNVHPVRVALNLQPTLIEDLPRIKKILELMCEKEMKRGAESNEVMSFKLHYLSCIVAEVIKCSFRSPEKQSDPVELFVRKILVRKRGEEYIDFLIRDIVREFPFRECTIFRQMVTSLANQKDSPPALSLVTVAINGQRGFSDDVKTCATCGEEKASKKCSKCKQVQYCDRECQRLHWFVHKKECNRNNEELINKMENSVKIN
ncbi:hypothetical protein AAG570_000134 [Ranatra chinensis]|uniref:MYND-type domain-containing protein n=1 Tax=Ranatra chinensis TaxID=642074 RepID=A0ABD0Z6M7_9HEMI